MEEETQNLKNWYTDYKKELLDKDIKRCGTYATISGAVAALSSLIVAGNLVVGNNIEALQVGGATAAMFAYTICYSKMSDTYKTEKNSLEENIEKSPIKQRLETLKYQLEIAETQLGLNYLVGGSFLVSAIAHVIELLSMPSAPEIVSNVTCATLGALVGTLNLMITKRQKTRIQSNKEETASLEQADELDEMSKKPILELVEPQEALEVDVKIEEEHPNILRLENIPRTKK